MSILDSVREKYKTLRDESAKGDKRASVTFGTPTGKRFQSFSTDKLRLIAGDDWPEIQADPKQLEAFKAAAATAAQIQRGEIPAHYTATTDCKRCGPVPIFPGMPDRLSGCPWCLARRRPATPTGPEAA